MDEVKLGYNDEPVVYCVDCLSLKLKRLSGTYDCYCVECGSMNTNKAHIENWEKLYKERYNKPFIENK